MPQAEFTIRAKVLDLFAPKFHIYRKDGALAGYVKQKAFRLKEDIRVYTDESMDKELMVIRARSIIDFGASYDVVKGSGEAVGTLRRKGLTSIARDSWQVLDPDGAAIGKLEEDSMLMALARRFVPMGNFIPQKYQLSDSSGREWAWFRTHFNPLIHKMTITVDGDAPAEPLLALATGVLLMAVEGRQKS